MHLLRRSRTPHLLFLVLLAAAPVAKLIATTPPPPPALPVAPVLDPSFASGLRLVAGDIDQLLPTPDGGLLVRGSQWSHSSSVPPVFQFEHHTRHGLIRIAPSGAVDPTWGGSLFAQAGTVVPQAIVSPHGRVYLWIESPGESTRRLLRLTPEGQLDPSFSFSPDAPLTILHSLTADADENVYFIGDDHAISHLGSDGTLLRQLRREDYYHHLGMALYPSGKIAVVALNGELGRLTATGSVDMSFTPTSLGPLNQRYAPSLQHLHVLEDDRVLVGVFHRGSWLGPVHYNIHSFGPNGEALGGTIFASDFTQQHYPELPIAPIPAHPFVRSDGLVALTAKNEFVLSQPGTWTRADFPEWTADADLSAIALGRDGSLYVAGPFTKLGKHPAGPVARLDVSTIIAAGGTRPRLFALAARARVGAGEDALIAGVIGSGDSLPPSILVRGLGPALASYGIAQPLPDPVITLNSLSGAQLRSNAGWDHRAAPEDLAKLAATTARSGLAPLAPGSHDTVIHHRSSIHHAGPPIFTSVLSSETGNSGVALLEVYEDDYVTTRKRLTALAARARVGPGENVLIGGFIVGGDGPLKLLLRGVGPTLATQGIQHPLANPKITLFNAAGQTLAQNDDWHSAGDLAALRDAMLATRVAFYAENSRDAALLVTLSPGAYTVHVTSADGTPGIGLAEIYEVP